MKGLRGFCAAALLSALPLLAPVAAPSWPQDAVPLSGASAVKASSYVSLDPVPRGRTFQIAVVVNIASGFHMNSHQPSDAYMIPTTLTPNLPIGISLVDTAYPAGHLEKFTFSPKKPLDVYTGRVTLLLQLAAQASAPLGRATIPMSLRVQVCSQTTCFPPAKVPVSAQLQVAEAGASSRPVHPEFFPAVGTAGK